MTVRPRFNHPWDLSITQATALQKELAARVEARPLEGPIRRVCGVDCSFEKLSPTLHAAAVVLDAKTLEVLEVGRATVDVPFPYVPGYLSFREMPPLIAAFEQLSEPPDLVVVDGHGTAHIRRFGLGCHLGVLFDIPTIGCGKSRFVGEHRAPGPNRGNRAQLKHRGEVIGDVLRTRDRVKPVYVSVGHRITLPEARRWILRLAPKWRQPETTRAAHEAVNRMRRAARGSEPVD